MLRRPEPAREEDGDFLLGADTLDAVTPTLQGGAAG